jgi:DNA-binding transcriptional LysR family regulator
VSGRGRIAGFQSVLVRIAVPAMQALAREAPRLRCELVEAEPEQALPALAVGDVDLVLGDEWAQQPWRLPAGLERHELLVDPVRIVLPAGHPAARRHGRAVPMAELAGEPWTSGPVGMAWEGVVERACRDHGHFEPDIRHRTTDATVSLVLVARGLAVTLLPDLVLPGRHPGVVLRDIAEAPLSRAVFAVTRASDAARPSTRALLGACVDAVAALPQSDGV